MLDDIMSLKCSGTFSVIISQRDRWGGAGFSAFRTLVGFSTKEKAESWLKQHEFKFMEQDDHQGHGGKFNYNTWLRGEDWVTGEIAVVVPEIDISNTTM